MILYAVLFGITMKVADLLDEHGLKWFRGADILFGLLWGAFGVMLVLSEVDVANAVLAIVMALLLRMKLDYRNHVIAAAMIIAAFAWKSTLNPPLFLLLFISFLIIGLVRDYLGGPKRLKYSLYAVTEPGWYYSIVTGIYGLFTGNYIIFIVVTCYAIAYNLMKYGLYNLRVYRKY